MTIYVIHHTLTNELLKAFTDKELAEKWTDVVNYSALQEVELETSPLEISKILLSMTQPEY